MDEPLAQKLRRIRSIVRLRQKEMADRLDAPLATYKSWEAGKKTPRKMAMPELERRINALFHDLYDEDDGMFK